MTIIKSTTKKGQAMINRADHIEGEYLNDVYGNYSHEKYRAWCYCKDLCHNENGYNFRICSHNTFGFSVAWDIIDKENGNITGVRIETPQNSYLVKIC